MTASNNLPMQSQFPFAALIGQPLLQRALHAHLHRGGQRVAVGREHQLQQAAAEVRPVDALAGHREKHLLDHVAHVRGVVRDAAAAACG